MKEKIHPEWYAEADVSCSNCGNAWTTGATVPSIRVEICSNCHPFYTGKQTIVDTEGRVEGFMKRLAKRDQMQQVADEREAAKAPTNLSIEDLGLSKRYVTILEENDITTVQDILDKLAESGDEGLLEFQGIGRKVLSDLKKSLRAGGYEIPEAE